MRRAIGRKGHRAAAFINAGRDKDIPCAADQYLAALLRQQAVIAQHCRPGIPCPLDNRMRLHNPWDTPFGQLDAVVGPLQRDRQDLFDGRAGIAALPPMP